jgi:hypothetical protein
MRSVLQRRAVLVGQRCEPEARIGDPGRRLDQRSQAGLPHFGGEVVGERPLGQRLIADERFTCLDPAIARGLGQEEGLILVELPLETRAEAEKRDDLAQLTPAQPVDASAAS